MDRRTLLTRAALMVAPVLLAELGLRAAHAAGAGPAGGPAEAVRRIAADLTVAGDGLTSIELTAREPMQGATADPFVGWSDERLWERVARGFGGDDTYDILVVGGSVAVYFQRGGVEDLIDSLLGDPRFAGRDIRLHNLAAGGRKQPQQLHLVSAVFNAGGRLPDAVINLDGFNELALSVQNAKQYGVHPLQPAYYLWAPLLTGHVDDPELLALAFDVQRERTRALELAAAAERWHLGASALLSTAVHARMGSIRARHGAATARYFEAAERAAPSAALAGAAFENTLEGAVELAVRCWAESSASLRAICAERAIPYLHVLQPTLLDAGSKTLTAEEQGYGRDAAEEWSAAIAAGYPRLREEGARLRERGVEFWDASQLFADIEEGVYTDACHFRGKGNYVLGHEMGLAFLKGASVR